MIMSTFSSHDSSSQSRPPVSSYEQSARDAELEAQNQAYITALAFIDSVKETFPVDTSRTFEEFTQLLRNFKLSDTKISDVVQEAIRLFDGHPHLLEGFHIFLPHPFSFVARAYGLAVLLDPVVCDSLLSTLADVPQAEAPVYLSLTPAISSRLSTTVAAYALHRLDLLQLVTPTSTAVRDAVLHLHNQSVQQGRRELALHAQHVRRDQAAAAVEATLISELGRLVEGSLAWHVASRTSSEAPLHSSLPSHFAIHRLHIGSEASFGQTEAAAKRSRRRHLISRLVDLDGKARQRCLSALGRLQPPPSGRAKELLKFLRNRAVAAGHAVSYERVADILMRYHRGESGPSAVFSRLMGVLGATGSSSMEEAAESCRVKSALASFFPGISTVYFCREVKLRAFAAGQRARVKAARSAGTVSGSVGDGVSEPPPLFGPSYRRPSRARRLEGSTHAAHFYPPLSQEVINLTLTCRAPPSHNLPRGEAGASTAHTKMYEWIDCLSRIDTLINQTNAMLSSAAQGGTVQLDALPKALADTMSAPTRTRSKRPRSCSPSPSPVPGDWADPSRAPSPPPLSLGPQAVAAFPRSELNQSNPSAQGKDDSPFDAPLPSWAFCTIRSLDPSELTVILSMLQGARADFVTAGPEDYQDVLRKWATKEPDLFPSAAAMYASELEAENGVPATPVLGFSQPATPVAQFAAPIPQVGQKTMLFEQAVNQVAGGEDDVVEHHNAGGSANVSEEGDVDGAAGVAES